MKIKKLVAMLATAAMAVGLVTVAPTVAKAVSGDGNVYLVGKIDNNWDTATAPAMTVSGSTYKYSTTISAAGNYDFKFLVGDNTGWTKEAGYNGDGSVTYTDVVQGDGSNMRISCSGAGTLVIEAVFDGDTVKSVKASGTALGELVLADEYYAVGAAGLFETAWGDNDFAGAKQLTETSTGVWSLTINNVAAGTYEFKVIQSTPLDWTNSVTSDNVSVEVKETSNVTITYTKATKELKAVATAVNAGGTTTGGTTTGGTTTGGTTNNTDTADMAPVAAMVAVAALAAVVVLKKKTVNE